MRLCAWALAPGATLALAACGPPPPQVPAGDVNRVEAAVTGIAEACGEARQQSAFSRGAPPGPAVAAEAALRARELASVYRTGPQRMFKGDTLDEVVALSVSYLRECGLSAAADQLERETS